MRENDTFEFELDIDEGKTKWEDILDFLELITKILKKDEDGVTNVVNKDDIKQQVLDLIFANVNNDKSNFYKTSYEDNKEMYQYIFNTVDKLFDLVKMTLEHSISKFFQGIKFILDSNLTKEEEEKIVKDANDLIKDFNIFKNKILTAGDFKLLAETSFSCKKASVLNLLNVNNTYKLSFDINEDMIKSMSKYNLFNILSIQTIFENSASFINQEIIDYDKLLEKKELVKEIFRSFIDNYCSTKKERKKIINLLGKDITSISVFNRGASEFINEVLRFFIDCINEVMFENSENSKLIQTEWLELSLEKTSREF